MTDRGYKANRAEEESGHLLKEEIARISKKKRTMVMLIAAWQQENWLTIRDLEYVASRGYIYTLLKAFKQRGWAISQQIPIKLIIGNVKRLIRLTGWQGTDALLSFVSSQEIGGLPRGSKKPEERIVDVIVRSLNEILDTARIKFEARQVVIALDPYVTKVLRDACDRPKGELDRAKQKVHSCEAFTINIPHTGNSQVTLKDWLTWDKSMLEWMQRAGLSRSGAEIVIKQIWNQVPGGTTRAEIPILEQAVKRLKVRCNVLTRLRKHGEIYAEVESNINYSLHEIGLEYFGTTRWVDAIIRVLIGLQHTTMVSEASRDKWIEDALEAVESLRKEREAKEKKDDDRWKDSLI